MRKIEVTLYKFDELPTDNAKEKARDWMRDVEGRLFGAHGELWEPAETAAKLLGIRFVTHDVPLHGGGTRIEPRIYWAGFSYQGDGASFAGNYSYQKGAKRAVRAEFPEATNLHIIADKLQAIQKRYGYKVITEISQSGRGVHSYTMDLTNTMLSGSHGDPDIISDEDRTELLSLMRSFADWIWEGLKGEYEYRMEDEQIDESLRANEYEFTEDGARA